MRLDVAAWRVLGGVPSLEMLDAATARGDDAVPELVAVLAEAGSSVPEDSEAALHALRALGEIRSVRSLPALLGALAGPGGAFPADEPALALASFGEPALPALEALLHDAGRESGSRGRAARALALAALRDRRLRPRVRAAFERRLRDDSERDARTVSLVVECARILAMSVLLPAVRDAHVGGRADPDFGPLSDIELDLLSRRQRPDVAAKLLARRDVRALYRPLAERLAALDPELRAGVARELGA